MTVGLERSLSTLFIEPISSKPPNREESQYLYKTFTIKTGLKDCHQHQQRPKESDLFSTKTYFPSSSRVGLPANAGSGKSIHGFPESAEFVTQYFSLLIITIRWWSLDDLQIFNMKVRFAFVFVTQISLNPELSWATQAQDETSRIQPKFIRSDDPYPNG